MSEEKPDICNAKAEDTVLLRDILVPKSLVRVTDKFKGRADGDCLRGDVAVRGNQIAEMRAGPATGRARMLIPALSEAHCHLDKCHSISRLGAVGGDLAAALDAQRRDKSNWTEDDLRARMMRGMSELEQAGCMAVRSHIDWGETTTPPLAWSVLQELAQEGGTLKIQAAALTGITQLADADFCQETTQHVARTSGGVLGAFLLHHDPGAIRIGLANAFKAASEFGLALDFHVDEGLGDFNGLEMICDAALDAHFTGPILCGHAVSLIDKSGAELDRIIEKLLMANISICALPTTNLYLQGRRDGTPDRRGLTRLLELDAAGVPIIIGSDNVGDAFCPLGEHDPRAALHLASLTAHLDPPMGAWLPSITLNPARAMGMALPYVDDLPLKDLRLCDVSTTADLIAGRAPLNPLNSKQEAVLK